MDINASPLCRTQLGEECKFFKNRNLPTPARVGEMQILETEGKTRLHIQQTASEPRVGETQLLMQPMRGSLRSIKSHLYGDLKD